MSYQAMVEMATSTTLFNRVVACAAAEGIPDPRGWAGMNIWSIAATPGWDNDWDYAKDTATVNMNPDIAMRDDVIGDAKILAAVQALWLVQNPPPEA